MRDNRHILGDYGGNCGRQQELVGEQPVLSVRHVFLTFKFTRLGMLKLPASVSPDVPRVFVSTTSTSTGISPSVSSLEEGEPLFVANLKSINDVLVFDTT